MDNVDYCLARDIYCKSISFLNTTIESIYVLAYSKDFLFCQLANGHMLISDSSFFNNNSKTAIDCIDITTQTMMQEK